ncbi:aminopeptidase [soil metagenome]
MDINTQKKYADLIIRVGINLYEGQCVLINSGVKNYDFALLVAEAAYKAGAKFVDINAFSDSLTAARVENNGNPDFLSFLPSTASVKFNEIIANDWALIRLDNLEEMEILKNADPSKLQAITKAQQIASMNLSKNIGGFNLAWTIFAVPGPNWAEKIIEGTGTTEQKIEILWDKLIPILRLDKADPVQEWLEHGQRLFERAAKLSKLDLDRVKFEGPGTDLEIGLNKECVWKGGYSTTKTGRNFIPNIPTEEIFTTPDLKRANGKVKVTKPVKVLENILTDIWFEFKDGKVIDYGCNKKEILDKFLTIDEGASYLGEVALVDSDSKVFESGLIFNSILYDENAACHIALGRGFSACIKNGALMSSPEELKKHGCNQSLVHTDFMIGSNEINVTGYNSKNEKIIIIKNGKFQID